MLAYPRRSFCHLLLLVLLPMIAAAVVVVVAVVTAVAVEYVYFDECFQAIIIIIMGFVTAPFNAVTVVASVYHFFRHPLFPYFFLSPKKQQSKHTEKKLPKTFFFSCCSFFIGFVLFSRMLALDQAIKFYENNFVTLYFTCKV